ncbi:DUF6519 domain-containing protein [Streptomyces chitinivorans]|uniref:DUF6519 domain-containing protein n=1 Tax=Streptomyces chitinivorans TaxID=1257027 RepID=A0ABW7HRM4_9ACTN|nr:DUF6519 domain-containing protein [Streptomyces chitinivorans]MDH2408566.1 DUF6519 domain-containing protein [Streptomyces chitinivorans]
MHADLSRITFRPERHYSAVLAQQGRVQLDADANEQTAIQLHRARTIAADLIGRHGGPAGATGFAIGLDSRGHELDDLTIGGGRYYVDGILCDASRPAPGDAVEDDGDGDEGRPDGEDGGRGGGRGRAEDRAGGRTGDTDGAPAHWTYWDQPDGHRDPERPGDRLPTAFPYLAYLKVWERTVTAAEDPALREVALGPSVADTAARVKVVWQVLALPASELEVEEGETDKDALRTAFHRWADERSAPKSRMAARSRRPERADEDPCLLRPDARYRGPENQLYRVEVHEGGTADEATFKWSRENGSVVLPVDGLDGTWAELATLGEDGRLDLNTGDWVEFADTAYTSRGEPLPLLRVEEVDLPGRRVRLSGEPGGGVGRRPELHPYLRRWDHREAPGRGGHGTRGRPRGGAVRVEEGRWLPLEDGVEVYFEPGGAYRPGDHWLIPARTATGAVEWPVNAARKPLLCAPAGIRVHHAPLAWVMGEYGVSDLRLSFGPLAGPVPSATEEELAAEARAEAEEEFGARAPAAREEPGSETDTAPGTSDRSE